ncbi:DUF6210 family protein [Psychrobacter sp. I-STPA6b]|uniref:DUF6210 family protein n=1 Tax=Psychrobacter sp. I-STPA6b TaxID=2585718 RepID=UPI001D0CD263|nr:DUF6210 family protein [Psychrobacter sp. I-STPA6b]
MTKRIDLYSLTGAMLIYPTPSGIWLNNQVGGHACLQKQVQGILIPIEQHYNNHALLSDLELKLYEIFAGCVSVTETMADCFDKLMQAEVTTNFICINRDKLTDSCEAWVYVWVNQTPLADFQGFAQDNEYFEAILTWNNSD